MRTKSYILPGGYHDGTTIHAIAEIGEATGEVQVAMNQPENKGDQVKTFNVIYDKCVKKIGDAKIEENFWARLLQGDLDYVVFQALKPWKGDSVRGVIVCQFCKTPFDLTLKLDQFKKYVLQDTYTQCAGHKSSDSMCPVEVIQGVKLVQGDTLAPNWEYQLKSDTFEVDAVFRLSYGYDSQRIAGLFDRNPVECLHLLYAITCKEWNGSKGPFTKEFFTALPQETIDWLMEEVRAHTPGLEPFDVVSRCPRAGCGAANTPVLSDFLPKAIRTRRALTARSRR